MEVALDRVRQVDDERVREVEGDPTNSVGREAVLRIRIPDVVPF